jgi:flagellar motor component MotA
MASGKPQNNHPTKPYIGIVILLVMVFGGFAFTGGALGPVMHAMPHEMLIIGGAAVGALVTGNSDARTSRRWAAAWARCSRAPSTRSRTTSTRSS